MPDTRIQVDGLVQLQRELRALDKSWPRALRLANKSAAEVVATETRDNFASGRGSSRKVVATVKALAQQRNASVKIGGGRSVGGAVALGNEFGGGKYGPGNPTARGGHTTQFPPFKKSGYALYPAIASTRAEVVEVYGDALDDLTRQAFPR